MNHKKSKKFVAVSVPFQLSSMKEPRPAGFYAVTIEQEAFSSRLVAASIYLPPLLSELQSGKLVPVTAKELSDVLDVRLGAGTTRH